jgi:V/A-type H+/Na+-transporting ATPase subunit C
VPTSQYSSSFGRLQALSVNFLSPAFMHDLLKSKDVFEIAKMLQGTWYGEEIEKAASIYQPPELLEVALNRHLLKVNKIALEASPFNGKNAVRAYLLKWDIYNIELILSSKTMGRTISETEPFLVSSRNFPAGISAGNIPHDEIKIILSQSGVEATVNQLLKYSYGSILLQYLDAYQKTTDLGPMIAGLQAYYYQTLLESLKFFQGDEGIIREMFRTEIDRRNILNLLKGKETNADKSIVSKHVVEGGQIPVTELMDIYGVNNVLEFVNRIENHFPLGQAIDHYRNTGSLLDFEIGLDKFINNKYVKKLKNIALSIGSIFYFIITAEHERENVRRIAYGKSYNISTDRISTLMMINE